MKSRLAAIAALLCLVAGMLLYSNIEKKAGEKGPLSFAGYGKETIHFWYTDEAMADYINSAAVAFGEKYDVRVIPKQVSDSEYLEAVNQASLHGENMPDAYMISNDSLEKAYLAGLAEEIADAGQIVNTEYFPQTALNAVTYKGKMVAYPVTCETSVLLYNKTYLREWALQQAMNEAQEQGIQYDETTLMQRRDAFFEGAVPATIDGILSIADTFESPETVEGVFRWDVSDIFYNYYFVGNYMIVGGDCGDDETNINIDNPQARACLEVYKALNQFFSIESDQVSYESVIQDFLEGKLVFTIATTDVVRTLEQAAADGTFAYEYGVAGMPDTGAELKGRSLSVTGTVAINGYSSQKEAANAFAAFLAQEYADQLYERSGKVSANKNVNTDNDILQTFMAEYAVSVPLDKMMETGNFWMQLEILFSKVWNGGDVGILVEELAAQIDAQVGTVG